MKFFIDTANIKEIREANRLGLIDGVTTNPTLLAKALDGKEMELKSYIRSICEEVEGPVSLEVLATTSEEMVKEARKLIEFGDNVVVKIPTSLDGLKAIRILNKEGIMTNATLCFSPSQAILVAKAGATFVSPFVGRLDDISSNGIGLIEEIVTIYRNYNFKTQVIVASIRHPMHVVESAIIGADIVTMPFKVLKGLINHPKTDEGIRRFLEDANKTNYKEILK